MARAANIATRWGVPSGEGFALSALGHVPSCKKAKESPKAANRRRRADNRHAPSDARAAFAASNRRDGELNRDVPDRERVGHRDTEPPTKPRDGGESESCRLLDVLRPEPTNGFASLPLPPLPRLKT